MNLAYVSAYNAQNILSWSGVPYYMSKALKDQSLPLVSISPLKDEYKLAFKAKEILYKSFMNKTYQRQREPFILKSYAKQICNRLHGLNSKVIFSPSTLPIAYLECSQPIVVWTDATFGGILSSFRETLNSYPEFQNLCEETVRDGHIAEQLALDRSSLLIYQSDWAAKTAIDIYNVNPDKIRVVPYGANLECNRSISDIKEMIDGRSRNICKLLFYGANWKRKGGDVAVEVAKDLNKAGLPTELIVIGGCPDTKEVIPDFVKFLGLISKVSEEGQNQINKLLSESHFLILPTKADCSPIAFPEANSFGVPCLATNIGGISTAIKNNLNGKLFDVDANPAEYCKYVMELFENYHQYQELALSSFNEYRSRLNWSVSGKKVKDLLSEFKLL